MTKRKGDFRSKIDSILADDPEPASAPGGASGLDRMFGAEGNGRQSDDALARHVAPTTETKLDEIDLKKIKLARGRRTDADRDLRDGIGKSGILQPLLLRPAGSGYEVLDGGRRLAVARELGLKTVPAVVRSIADSEARAMSAERKASAATPARPGRKPAATVARPVRGAARGRKAAAVAAGAATAAAARPRAAAPIAAPPPARRRAAAVSSRKSTGASAKATPAKATPEKATSAKATPAKVAPPRPSAAKTTAAKAAADTVSTTRAAAAKAPAKSTAPKAPVANARAAKAPAAKAAAATSAKRTAAQKAEAFAAAATRARADAAAKAAAKPATRKATTTAKGSAAGKPGPRRSAEKISPVEAPAVAVAASAPAPKVVFGQADETVEMRRPSIAAAADAAAGAGAAAEVEEKTADETLIWQRPKDDDRVPAKPAAIASTALTRTEDSAPAPSFPRQDETPVSRPIPASSVRAGTTTAAPSRGRSVIQTLFFMLALFALAFAATTLAVYGDVGLSLQAGLICVVALVLFAAVTLTGRRTGP